VIFCSVSSCEGDLLARMCSAPRFSHMQGRSALPWRINVIRARMVVTWHRLVFNSGLRQWFMKSFSDDAFASRFLIKSHRKRKVPTYNVISESTRRLLRLSEGSVVRNSVIYIISQWYSHETPTRRSVYMMQRTRTWRARWCCEAATAASEYRVPSRAKCP